MGPGRHPGFIPSPIRVPSFPVHGFSVFCFTLAVNDIVTAVLDRVSYSLDADDFVLYSSGSSLPSAVRRMQLAINRVADGTDSHGFRFSVEKSHAFPEPSLPLYGLYWLLRIFIDFALLVHPRLLDGALWVLTFWSLNSRVPLRICLFLLKLVKVSQ